VVGQLFVRLNNDVLLFVEEVERVQGSRLPQFIIRRTNGAKIFPIQFSVLPHYVRFRRQVLFVP
jgi:hypothetical protein